MSLLFYMIGALMISIAVGSLTNSAIGFITFGAFFIFAALLDELLKYLQKKNGIA